MSGVTDPVYCKRCMYYGPSMHTCDYWDKADELRGCPPGKDCTRRKLIGTKRQSKNPMRVKGYSSPAIVHRQVIAMQLPALDLHVLPNGHGSIVKTLDAFIAANQEAVRINDSNGNYIDPGGLATEFGRQVRRLNFNVKVRRFGNVVTLHRIDQQTGGGK